MGFIETGLSESWCARVRALPRTIPQVLVYAGLRLICNGIITTRRLGSKEVARCIFCKCVAGDSVQHLVRCHVAAQIYSIILPDMIPPGLEPNAFAAWAALECHEVGLRLIARLAAIDSFIAALTVARARGRPFRSLDEAVLVVSARLASLTRSYVLVRRAVVALRRGLPSERWTPSKVRCALADSTSDSSSSGT